VRFPAVVGKAVRPEAAVADSASSVDILGTRLDLNSKEEIGERLRRALAEPWDGLCRHVVTLNPEYVMAAQRDPSFAAAVCHADLVTADGAGVVAAARLIHGVKVERMTGVELMDWLARLSGEMNAPLFLLGAAQGVADAAAANLRERNPGLCLAGTWADGSPRVEHDAPALERIAASEAKIVAVAYGAPAQILWIARNQGALAASGVRLVIGVGGALDYLSGTVALPPEIVRRLGLEWLARLIREPYRWRRQLVLPVFAGRVLVQAASMRLRERRQRRFR
jgi:N-acetylglucosaminyldiphosphoundecaprenol N-acetyl-beta-D-mannosaminyltransferase